jgi:hypothetical protein
MQRRLWAFAAGRHLVWRADALLRLRGDDGTEEVLLPAVKGGSNVVQQLKHLKAQEV